MSNHVWRQTQTQSTIDNFHDEDMNIMNPRRNDRGDGEGIFRMEFPIMQWTVACAYKVFGKHLIISRIMMFIIGLLSLFGFYRLLQSLFNSENIALIGVWAMCFSPSFYYYTINPLPDNLALCSGIWGLTFFFNWYSRRQLMHLVLSSMFFGLATLCKLPFIIYFIIPAVYFCIQLVTNKFRANDLKNTAIVFFFSLLPIAWYAYVIPQWNGNMVVSGIFDNSAGIDQSLDYLQHNLISTLPELLLNYGSVLFFLCGFYFLVKRKAYKDKRFILVFSLSGMACVYYIFEINAIAKVHDYYLFPFFPILFMLVAYGAYHFIKLGDWQKYFSISLLLILPITCYLRMAHRWDPQRPGFNKDLLTYKEDLKNAVPDDALVVAGNDDSRFIWFYHLDKKGWTIHHNNLTKVKLDFMVKRGAQYLYIDSISRVNNPEVEPFCKNQIIKRGSIEVFKL